MPRQSNDGKSFFFTSFRHGTAMAYIKIKDSHELFLNLLPLIHILSSWRIWFKNSNVYQIEKKYSVLPMFYTIFSAEDWVDRLLWFYKFNTVNVEVVFGPHGKINIVICMCTPEIRIVLWHFKGAMHGPCMNDMSY